MDETDNPIDEARKAFDSLKNTTDSSFWVDWSLNRMRAALAKAGADAAALDPEMKKTAAEMEAEITAAEKEACLRGGRKKFSEFIESGQGGEADSFKRALEDMAESMRRAGLGLEALDESGQRSAQEVSDCLDAAIRRRALIEARKNYQEWITTRIAGWGDMTEWHEKKIADALALAGEDYAALDPAATEADIRRRIAEASCRLRLLHARERFHTLETTTSTAYSSDPKSLSRQIRQHVAAAGADLAALDETGKSSVADIEARIGKAERRLLVMGAREAWNGMKGDDDSPYGSADINLKRLRNLLEAAGADASALDASGRRSAAEMEAEITVVAGKMYLEELRRDLEQLKTAPPPNTSARSRALRKACRASSTPRARRSTAAAIPTRARSSPMRSRPPWWTRGTNTMPQAARCH
jgi:hypothetical protein